MARHNDETELAARSESAPTLVCYMNNKWNKCATHAQMYVLSDLWEAAIGRWLIYLTVAGVPATTMRLRRGHLRWAARNTDTAGPADVTFAGLLTAISSQNWSREHRRGMRRSLVTFFDWAIDDGIVETNPAVRLPKVPGGHPHPRPCPDDIWDGLLASAGPREAMMSRLAGEVGMRRAEVACCRRDDLFRDMTGWSLIVHGKGDRQRVVPITDALAASIRDFCVAGYLFPGDDDGHLSPMTVGKLISDLMPAGWSMHKLRHRYATRGLAGTGDLLAVRDALGHASVATTQLYTAVADERVRRVTQAASSD